MTLDLDLEGRGTLGDVFQEKGIHFFLCNVHIVHWGGLKGRTSLGANPCSSEWESKWFSPRLAGEISNREAFKE